MPVIKASLSGYEGQSGSLEGENDIRHVQAFHFKNGVLTKVYDDLQFDGSDCRVPLDSKEGVLYMLANAEGMVDGQALLDQNLTEAEWKETVLPLKDGKEAHFFLSRGGGVATSGGCDGSSGVCLILSLPGT